MILDALPILTFNNYRLVLLQATTSLEPTLLYMDMLDPVGSLPCRPA